MGVLQINGLIREERPFTQLLQKQGRAFVPGLLSKLQGPFDMEGLCQNIAAAANDNPINASQIQVNPLKKRLD